MSQYIFAEAVADPKRAQEREYFQVPEDKRGFMITYKTPKALTDEVEIRKD